MREDLIKLLGEKKQNAELSALLQSCKEKVNMSRDEMAKNYPAWDFADQVYRGEVKPDLADKKAQARKEPGKMLLPMTKSQVETFVAFTCRMFTQRPTYFQLDAYSDEDERPARMGECTLERDLKWNNYKGVILPAFVRSIAKYGIGIKKETWNPKTKQCKTMVPDPTYVPNPNLPPIEPPMIEQVEEKTMYLGNKIINVSPYQFFPDPSLPITRFQEGEFCASEEEQSFTALQEMERRGIVAGIEHVRRTCDGDIARRLMFAEKTGARDPAASKGEARYGVLTEVQVRLVPSETLIAPGVVLDKNITQSTICLIQYVNDDRIVRIEPDMGYEHDEFSYSVAQFLNDGERFINGGIVEDIGALQEAATWFINSHITSVRKVIDNRLIVDPKFVEMEDLEKRRPVIRTKPGASMTTMERWFFQLEVRDVTQKHVEDADRLNAWAKEGTGINENLLGQFAAGRRSALEARNVNSNSAARLILTVSGIWDMGEVPMGKRMLSNLRQGLDVPQFVRVYGETRTLVDNQASALTDPQGSNALARFLPVNKTELVGNYDFQVFDGTLPSQRGATAMQLRELLMAMAANPQSIPVLGFDPQLVLTEILELSDVRNVNRLRLTPARLQQLMLMAQPQGQPAGTQQPASGA
jgi:hypothetical protein